MKVNFNSVKKFLLLGIAIYIASCVIFLMPLIFDWPTWYRSILGALFVVGIALCVDDESIRDGYTRKFWRDHLEIITAFANLEDIRYLPKGGNTWYSVDEEHCFKAANKYEVIKPKEVTKSSTNSQSTVSTPGDAQ